MSSKELKNKNKFTAQPKLVVKLLGFILNREDAEILLGDFAEEFFTLTSNDIRIRRLANHMHRILCNHLILFA